STPRPTASPPFPYTTLFRSPSRSRQITTADFERLDLALAMDHSNLDALRELCPPEHAHKLRLFLDFAPERQGQAVPDPYYGDARSEEHTSELQSRENLVCRL